MSGFLRFFQGRQDIALIALVMATIMVMIIPLPTVMIDVLLAVNIALSLLVLVVAVYLKRPADFSSFPAVILIATTFRLAITISTTRLILSQADAGAVIDTFGTFVTRGSVLVGLVIFLIITTVQFIVVTKGAERVAEVAARFTLDGLPGRQMSIDAELRSGDIDGETAQRKRAELDKENQFYGAMDGAMKFVKGDAIAGLIIVAINLIGGLTTGMMVHGLPAEAAVNVYSRLTVGDGLVSQIPALIVAMCAGIITTRVNSGSGGDLGSDIFNQLAGGSKALMVAGAIVAAIGLVPGLPWLIFFAIGGLLAFSGYMAGRSERQARAEAGSPERTASVMAGEQGGAGAGGRKGDKAGSVTVALGEGVLRDIDQAAFVALRDAQIDELYKLTGIRMPPFMLMEDPDLDARAIHLVLDGVTGFSAEIPDGMRVAICEADLLAVSGVEGTPVDEKWPLRSAFWVDRQGGRGARQCRRRGHRCRRHRGARGRGLHAAQCLAHRRLSAGAGDHPRTGQRARAACRPDQPDHFRGATAASFPAASRRGCAAAAAPDPVRSAAGSLGDLGQPGAPCVIGENRPVTPDLRQPGRRGQCHCRVCP